MEARCYVTKKRASDRQGWAGKMERKACSGGVFKGGNPDFKNMCLRQKHTHSLSISHQKSVIIK